jgi:hypothetical protein
VASIADRGFLAVRGDRELAGLDVLEVEDHFLAGLPLAHRDRSGRRIGGDHFDLRVQAQRHRSRLHGSGIGIGFHLLGEVGEAADGLLGEVPADDDATADQEKQQDSATEEHLDDGGHALLRGHFRSERLVHGDGS